MRGIIEVLSAIDFSSFVAPVGYRGGPGARSHHRGAGEKNLSARHPEKHTGGRHPIFGAREQARAAHRAAVRIA